MASEAENHGGGGGLPQLDFETWPSQIFWLVVALGVLYFILSRFALPKLEATINERADAIARDIERASEFNARAEEAIAAYEKKLADARNEARRMSDEAQAESAAKLKEALAEADERINAQLAESEKRLDAIRAESAAKAEEVAQEAAQAIAARFGKGGVDQSKLFGIVTDRVRAQLGG